MKWNGQSEEFGKPGNMFSVIQLRDDFVFTRLMRVSRERNGWLQLFKCATCMEVRGLRRKRVQEMTPLNSCLWWKIVAAGQFGS